MYIIVMIGKIVRFVDSSHDQYPEFVGHCGYVLRCAKNRDTGVLHLAVKWFKPHPVYAGYSTDESHFMATKFEVVS